MSRTIDVRGSEDNLSLRAGSRSEWLGTVGRCREAISKSTRTSRAYLRPRESLLAVWHSDIPWIRDRAWVSWSVRMNNSNLWLSGGCESELVVNPLANVSSCCVAVGIQDRRRSGTLHSKVYWRARKWSSASVSSCLDNAPARCRSMVSKALERVSNDDRDEAIWSRASCIDSLSFQSSSPILILQ